MLFGLFFLFLIPLVLADASSLMSGVWNKILSIGRLDFLGISSGSMVASFTRILIGFLVFTIFYAVIISMSGKKGALSFLNGPQAKVVAAIVAIISAIFIPADVLLAVGAGWATAVSLLLIGGPIVGLALLLWKFPADGKETRSTLFLKFILCLLLFWILSAMKYHVGRMA